MENPPPTKCLLREYVEKLRSGEDGMLGMIIDRQLDQSGNGYGTRDCDSCELRVVAENGSPDLDPESAVRICHEISDASIVPDVIC